MGHVLSERNVGKHDRLAFAIAAAGLTFDKTVKFEGEELVYFLLECYDATNAVTRTVSIIDANTVTVWTDGTARADNSKNSIPVFITDGVTKSLGLPLDGTYTVRITLSDVAGGTGGTDYLTLFVK